MVFNRSNIELDVGAGAGVNTQKPLTIFYYADSGDTLSVITANNYFPKELLLDEYGNKKYGAVHIKVVSSDFTSFSWFNLTYNSSTDITKAVLITALA
jgi:hypothetical protein